jgi:hypothetical protein
VAHRPGDLVGGVEDVPQLRVAVLAAGVPTAMKTTRARATAWATSAPKRSRPSFSLRWTSSSSPGS